VAQHVTGAPPASLGKINYPIISYGEEQVFPSPRLVVAS